MAQGVHIEIRHFKSCPAEGRDARRCTCSPTARAQIARRWVFSRKLPRGWRASDVNQVELDALKTQQDHASGRKVIRAAADVPTLREWAEQWLNDREAQAAIGDYSPATIRTYRSVWKNHIEPELGGLRLTALTPQVVMKVRADKINGGLMPAYVGQMFFMLSGILSDAIPDYLAHNPASVQRARRGRSAPHRRIAAAQRNTEKVMEVDLARALLADTSGVLHEMVLLALTTGMRRLEIAGLKWESVDFSSWRIEVENQLERDGDRLPKNGRVRPAVLYRGLGDLLAARYERATSEYVFLDPDWKRPFADAKMQKILNHAWGRIAERAKGHSWHVLRHTFASLLAYHGVRPLLIDVLMGHKDATVMGRYQHTWGHELDVVEPIMAATFGAATVPQSAEVLQAAASSS